jgi:hypothetical protein
MLNGEFTNTAATALAKRLSAETSSLDEQVRRAIRLTVGRMATDDEVRKDVGFVRDLKAKAKLTDAAALQQYCLLALNTNEFVYLD